MFVLIDDIEKRVEALEKSKQDKNKLKFSFSNSSSSLIPPPVFTNEATNGATTPKTEEGREVTLDVKVQNANTVVGQFVYIVGDLPELGNMDESKAVTLSTSMF